MKGRARSIWAWGLVLLVLGLIAVASWAALSNLSDARTSVTIGGTVVRARVVSNDADLQKGLGGVTQLDAGSGMLFVFPRDGPQEMWMKDMAVDLDIIWLNKAKTVVHVERNLTPATYPATFRSDKPARYVLEVPAGTAAQSSIMVGSTASFDLPAGSRGATMGL